MRYRLLLAALLTAICVAGALLVPKQAYACTIGTAIVILFVIREAVFQNEQAMLQKNRADSYSDELRQLRKKKAKKPEVSDEDAPTLCREQTEDEALTVCRGQTEDEAPTRISLPRP